MSRTPRGRERSRPVWRGGRAAQLAGVTHTAPAPARPVPPLAGPRGLAALVVGAQLGEAPAEVMEVVQLPVQHLQEAPQLRLEVALAAPALLHVGLQGAHFIFQVLIVPLGRLEQNKARGSGGQRREQSAATATATWSPCPAVTTLSPLLCAASRDAARPPAPGLCALVSARRYRAFRRALLPACPQRCRRPVCATIWPEK